jgi:hypothetical protein
LIDGSDQWSLRVTGVPELALRHPTASRYWDGEIRLTLDELHGAEADVDAD